MSSVESEGESDCSSTSSRNGGISSSDFLSKLKKKNINLKNFKIMLVNGLSKTKTEADLTPELEKEAKFSATGDSAPVDNDKAFSNNKKSLANNDIISSDGDQANEFNSTGAEVDDKGSIDENSFELRIDNDDDDNDEHSDMKHRVKLDLDKEKKKSSDVPTRSKNIVDDEHSLSPNVGSSEKVRCRSYLSTDLENICIPDTANNDDYKNRKLTLGTPITVSSESSSRPVIRSVRTQLNCAFCEKKFGTKNSLKFHVLSHLKSFLKQDGIDNFVVSTSEIDNLAAESTDRNASLDFACVFCDKSFANKMNLRIHYKVDHRAAVPKGSPQNQNRSSVALTSDDLNLRRPSSENKIDSEPVQSIISVTDESPANLNADENGCNEDASKQYKCYICDKQFARNSSLMWHIQFHETHLYSKLKKNNTELENGLSPGGGGGGGTGSESVPVDADPPFRCHICGKTYESLAGHRRHVANHGVVDEEAGLGEKCELCNKYYPTAVGLKRHIIFMHKDHLPPPPAEDVEDVGAEDGIDSISSSSVSDEYVCNLCDRPFTHRNSYKRHMILVHKLSSDEVTFPNQQTSGVKCESCGKFFSSVGSMRNHVLKHCKKTLATPNIAEDEENTSKDELEKSFCDICQRSFCSQRALNIHRAHVHRTELGDSVASDTVASDTVVSDTVVSDTMTSDMIPCDAYIEKEGGFQCTVCDKIFESRKGVVRHIGYHRSALSVQMALNNAGADDPLDDNDDEVEEEEEDDDNDEEEEDGVACPECGKTFNSIRGMRIHANSHRETTLNDDDEDDDENDNESESGFDCNICNETFEGYRSFRMHISWHRRRGEEPGMFRKKSAKSTHTPRSFHSGPGKIYQCQHCPRWYTTQQALAGHMKAHQPQKATAPSRTDQLQPSSSGGKTSKALMCRVCGQPFPNSSTLSSHMKLHIEEGVATPTTSSGQLLTLEDTMECDMCGKFFMRKQDMAKHMRDHMNGVVTKENVDLSLFRCIYCQKSFVGRKSLNTHQVLHEEAQVALKRAANELLSGAPPAKQHRPNDSATAAQENLIGWDDMMQAHQCEECDRRLSTKQSLRRHMEWHVRMRAINGGSAPALKEEDSTVVAQAPVLPPLREPAGTPFECLYCRKSFRTKDLLVDHTKIHEGLPAVGPPTVVVNDLEALGEHAVVQCIEGGNEEYFVFEQCEGEAYQCSECDETHFDKLQMIVHMSYHVGQRWANGCQRALTIKVDPVILAPFECMFCDERFVNMRFRTRHVLHRHGDEVLHCGSCKKMFLSKKKLAVHCRRHFVDSMYRCEHCLKSFASKWFLKRHARKKCVGKSSPERKEMLLPNSSAPSFKRSPSAHVPEDHECRFCGLLVNDTEAFLGHLQSHVLKYECENCDFGCENVLELDSHACIVTTTESVSCGQCDDVFGDGAELEAHRQALHDGTVLCDVCSELFPSENDLQIHKRSKHSSDRGMG